MMGDVAARLRDREAAVEAWVDALRKRRAALAKRYEAFTDPGEVVGVPEGLARELRGLIESLVGDLDAQIEDLEGDLDTLERLQSMLEAASGETRSELVTYAEELDGALAEKGRSIEELVETADGLIDRFDTILEPPEDLD